MTCLTAKFLLLFPTGIVRDLRPGMTTQSRLQILPQASRTRDIAFPHRLFRRHRTLGGFVVNELTSRHMKQFGPRRNHNHQVGRNVIPGQRMLRPDEMPVTQRVRQLHTSGDQDQRRHRHQPRRPARPSASLHRSIRRETLLQPPTETRRHLEHALIAIQLNHIPHPRHHRRTTRAGLEMFVHRRSQCGIHVSIDVIRYFTPHLFAVQHSLIRYHGLFPFSNGNRLNQPCSHPAASRSRSISRARNSRVFTEATVMPSASAVS